MNPVWSVILDILAGAIAMGGPLNGAKVILIAAGFVPSRDLRLSDVVEATFTGYATSSAVTWGVPYIGGDGQAHVTAGSKQFTATDGVTPNVIYGWGLVDSGGTNLLGAALLANPVPLSAASDGVVIEPDYVYGQ